MVRGRRGVLVQREEPLAGPVLAPSHDAGPGVSSLSTSNLNGTSPLLLLVHVALSAIILLSHPPRRRVGTSRPASSAMAMLQRGSRIFLHMHVDAGFGLEPRQPTVVSSPLLWHQPVMS